MNAVTDAGATSGLQDRGVRRWLLTIWCLIGVMVMVGGVTRLTGSGLSMVEWQPLIGAIPPIGEAQWHEVFEQYKRSPQFQQVNHWMQLADFQRIFLWEYLHRLLGRAIGVVFFVPWLYFVVRRRLYGAAAWRTAVAFLLGGLQGLLGWYMVMSGLVDRPEVSHFRLAAHLVLAFAIGQWVVWLWLDGGSTQPPPARPAPRRLALSFYALAWLQVVYGAFMAGTRAGYYYGSFPDMNGEYLPGSFFTGVSVLHDALNSPTAIHYLHRALGWATMLFAIALYVYLRRAERQRSVVRAAAIVCALAFVQFNLGALTVVLRVAIHPAIAHQGVAYLLVSAATALVYVTRHGASARGVAITG